jgi:signal peptidase I
LSKALKNEYVKTAILAIIVIGAVFAFWYGLRWALRTDYPLLAVASESMYPTLTRGDLIVVEWVPASEIYAAPQTSHPPGDIIVFQGASVGLPNELIVHRAISKFYNNKTGTYYFITHGDNNPPGANEGPFPDTAVVGKVIYVIPWIGNVPLFLRTPTGMLLIVFLFLIVILAESIPILVKKTGSETKAL